MYMRVVCKSGCVNIQSYMYVCMYIQSYNQSMSMDWLLFFIILLLLFIVQYGAHQCMVIRDIARHSPDHNQLRTYPRS